ncbi:MAG: hypothetical protein WKG07_09440 [Hymenobacter sp.]
MLVKVLEIAPELVKCRRFDNPDGPLISVRKADVFRLKCANGTQEILTPARARRGPAYPRFAGHRAGPYPAAGRGQPRAGRGAEPGSQCTWLGRTSAAVLTDGVLNRAREQVKDLNRFLTQFGWQFESRLFQLPNGVSGLVELVPLVGGLEQGHFIPSVSGLLGLRGPRL